MLITISDIPIFPNNGIYRAPIEIQTPSNCPMCNRCVTVLHKLNL